MRIDPNSARLLALVVLVGSTFGSSVEPLVGALRDGTVHHESLGVALSHASARYAVQGDHGHEDGSRPTTDPQHGLPHQHGTAADHCTHAHGLGLPAGIVVSFATVTVSVADVDHTTYVTAYFPIRIPPPRA